MRKLNVIGATMDVLLLSAVAYGQPITTTILVDWNPQGGGGICGYYRGTINTTFTDTAGSNWNDLKIRIPLAVELREVDGQPGLPATVSVAINGVQVGDPVFVDNHETFGCGGYLTYEFEAASLAGYHALGTNTFTFNSVGGSAGNAGEPAELIFTTEPRTFAFDLAPSMSQRLLIHKRAEDTYPSPWQVETGFSERPRFRFRGGVTAKTGSPEADVWLRVIDPADPSLYLPTRSANDNQDPSPKGVLMPRGCADASCRAPSGQPLQIHASPGGTVEVELEATDRYAGDDYYLEASFDAQFTCATAGPNGTDACARSGLVTAWKRIYVETDQMFTAGAMLREAVIPCVGTTCPSATIIKVDDAASVAHAKRLRMIHAPRFDGVGPQTFYSEDVDVVKVNRRENTIEISNPTKSYYGPDFINSIGQLSYLADAVGQISGSSDFFTVNTGNIDELFLPAFIEHVWLTNDPVPFIPFFSNVTGSGQRNDMLDLLAQKWFQLRGDENVQHLIAGSANGGTTLGITGTHGVNFAWVFDDSISKQVHNHNRAYTFKGEITAHELAHEFRVNPSVSGGGHCAEKQWDDSTKWCSMHGSYDDFGNCSGVCAEFYDGKVAFHYRAGDSEYLQVRRVADPFPQD